MGRLLYLAILVLCWLSLKSSAAKPISAGEPANDTKQEWATYFGGTDGNTSCNGLAHDSRNNIYITGSTTCKKGFATAGAYRSKFNGGFYDGFLAKFSPAGKLLWASYFGGENYDNCEGIAIDSKDNIYITGFTNSRTGIARDNAFQKINSGESGAFVAKFSPNGLLSWSTYFSGDKRVEGRCIAIDGNNNIYITGITSSLSGIATKGAWQTRHGGGEDDAYLVKFSEEGKLVWATYFGGEGTDRGFGVATDHKNNIIIAGYTSSDSGIHTPNADKEHIDGTHDAFVTKFNDQGQIIWSSYYGGNGSEEARDVAIDKDDNIYITGSTGSETRLATSSAYKKTYSGGYRDAFLAKFSPAGILKWSTYFGGTGNDGGYGLAADNNNNIIITGRTQSPAGISTPGSYQEKNETGPAYFDAFIAKFNNQGVLAYSSFYGGENNDEAARIITGHQNEIYFIGTTNSYNGISTKGANKIKKSKYGEAFLVKFKE